MEIVSEVIRGFGSLFYLVNPYETTFEKVEDIPNPNYVTKASPYFLSLVLMEHIALKLQGKKGIRYNDGVMSIVHGFLMLLKDLLCKGLIYEAYLYIYEHHRIYELPWNSLGTWIIAALGIDLGYYWVHRAAHEIHFLWAAHQVHHSSEEYNLTTALRQSVMQGFGSWPFYLPLALFLPPSHMMVHSQFNLLYQFWIHTEIISTLGPLEYIFNTPQHHRVHHGSNRYCLDKNYAGVLIIWDMMFGTFQWEKKEKKDKIVYGLVDQPQFFNPLKHQSFYYGGVLRKAQSMDTVSDKIAAVVKGPGWFPGTPRLGDPMGAPERQNRAKYNPKVPGWVNVYVFIHVILVYLAFEDLGKYDIKMSLTAVTLVSLFLIWTLTSVGMLFDRDQWAWPSEFARGVAFLMIYHFLGAWSEFRIPVPILTTAFAATVIISVIVISGRFLGIGREKSKMS